jgi:flavin-dependent dehydrogenase
VFVVGDAAGYIEPFTGEGMAWAMCGGLALVPIAVEAARKGWSEALAAEWTARHRERVGKRQLACHAVAAMLRQPALLRGAMHILAAWPGLVGPIMRRLNEPIPQVERVPQ